MLQRRHLLTLPAGLALAGLAGPVRRAHAQASTGGAVSFVRQTGERMTGIINGPGSGQQKRQAITQIVDTAVDVDGIARFCLGRYWRQASPEQQKRYVALFHQVLVTNITSKLGEYKGVKFNVGRAVPDGDNVKVATVIERPNSAPANVDWVISSPGGQPKIEDVVAEGTSLRLTQRSDYSSYLTHNGNNIDALIAAMQRQIQQNEATG